MKKTLTPLLIAAAVALSACGQDLSGGDWRTTGVVQAAGTISRSGADTDVLVCVHEGDAVFYRDSADQELFGQVVYPMDGRTPGTPLPLLTLPTGMAMAMAMWP